MRHGCPIAGLALLFFIAAAVSATADPVVPQRPSAGCTFLPAEHILAVTIKVTPAGQRDEAEQGAATDGPGAPPRSGEAYVARSGDAIAVFAGPDADPVACTGGAPTVTNTDFVLVRAGDRVKKPELAVDMRRGILGPGFTDERDGTSEIEVFADLGRRSRVVVAATSGADHVTVGPLGNREAVNVNATEAVDDPDVLATTGSVIAYGGAGPDTLAAFAATQRSSGAGLVGGGGADLILGSEATDLLQGDGGADILAAGGASDIVLGLDRDRDLIDCGTGNDTFVVVDRADRLSGCERSRFADPFGGADAAEAAPRGRARPQALLATPDPAALSGLTQNEPSAKP